MTSTTTRAIVTGHSRGLGEAVADALVQRGVPVLALARSANAGLASRHGDNLVQVGLDLADPHAVARWLDDGTLARFVGDAKLVLLVNNAGTVQPVGPLPMQPPLAVASAVALNVTAPLMLSAALSAITAARTTGAGAELRVLHVSSGAGRNPYPGWSVYCATKAALDHHARAAVADRTPGVRIESVAPGVIDTDMQAEIRATDATRFPLRERFVALDRDGALEQPADVAARLVTHLLSARFGQQPVTDLREMQS